MPLSHFGSTHFASQHFSSQHFRPVISAEAVVQGFNFAAWLARIDKNQSPYSNPGYRGRIPEGARPRVTARRKVVQFQADAQDMRERLNRFSLLTTELPAAVDIDKDELLRRFLEDEISFRSLLDTSRDIVEFKKAEIPAPEILLPDPEEQRRIAQELSDQELEAILVILALAE